MHRQLRLLIALTVWIVGLIAVRLAAQGGLGSVTGTVLDQTGGALPGATIQVVELSTGSTRTSISNEVGLFNVPSLPPGTYEVTLVLQNFKAKKFEKLTLNSFQQLSLGQITLELSVGATDMVEVSASTTPLEIDSGVRSETVQADQVHDMPLQGRNWASLLKVIPGSNPTNSTALNGREYSATGYSEFRINGKSPTQTQVNLDGGSLVDQGSDAKTTVAPSLESIQEISVLTNNFQAEYGNRGGTVINIVTKSGTNQLRGSLFDYMRNEGLNAGSWADNFTGKAKPKYRYNYVGGNLGGPIRRNTLFFFYNVENFKQAVPGALLTGRVPTLLERNGDFSQTVNSDGTRPTIFMPGTQSSGAPLQIADRIIPANLISPLGRAILNAYPLPNNPGDPSNNFVQQVEATNPRVSNTMKVDWNASEKSHVSARYTDDEGVQIDRSISNTSGIFPGGSVRRPRPDRAAAANYTRTFSPTLVMNSTLAWSYDFVEWLPADEGAISRKTLGLTGLPSIFPVTDDIIPAMTIGTYPNWAFNRMPAYARAHELQGGATVSWAKGAHMIKYGAQHIMNYKDEIDQSVNKGSYDFSTNASSPYDTGYAPANVLVGAVSRYQQIEKLNRKYSIYRDIHTFIQDTWKPTRDLTLDYGLRLSHMPTQYNTRPDDTLDAVFLPSKWDPAKAPRYYVPDPKNTALIIDPANPSQPLPANLANSLRFTIVPGSGDLLNGIVALGKNGQPKAGIPNPRAILLAPRGGFAWTPFEDTVLRGGFGWAYNRNSISTAINRFENGLGRSANIVQTSLDTLSATTNVQPILAKSYGARDETSNRLPTTYDYSLSMQRQFSRAFVLDVAYIGNQQVNQPLDFNLNAIPPGTAFKPEFVDPRVAGSNFAGPISSTNPGPALPGTNIVDPLLLRPYLGFDSLTMTANVAKVTYNSFQVNVTNHLPGLTVDAFYTLASTKGQTENVPPYYKDWQRYTGYNLNDDRRHVVALNYIYEVPEVSGRLGMNNAVGRGVFDKWRIAHVFSFVSGQKFSPGLTIQQAKTTTNIDLNRVFLGTPDFGPRVAVVGDPNGAGADLAHQFDATALGVPGIYPAADGTGPRNFIRGLPTFSNDVSLIKPFALQGNHMVELRVNFYNVFNNVRRTSVNSGITYKANGATFAEGFTIFNTPEGNVDRSKANGITDPLALYNQYRAGVGHTNVTSVSPNRIIEIGLALRF